MGIPRLTTLLKPYASVTEWKRSQGNDGNLHLIAKHNLIIDGPSLAYYVYNQCLASILRTHETLVKIPTYEELGCATIAWLNKLESFGLRIKHVFFDGLLPPTKVGIRNERLQKTHNRLRAFRLLNSDVFGDITSPSLKSLPVPPFLVSAVIEALLSSAYGSRVEVVPCEADVRCAAYNVCTEEDIILTNDSDLIIQQPRGRIMFLSDIAIQSRNHADEVLTGSYYVCKDIAERLQCPDLTKLGYYLKTEHDLGLQKCADLVRTAKPTAYEAEEYNQFLQDYVPDAWYSTFAKQVETIPAQSMSTIFRSLDPRTSELVHEMYSGICSKQAQNDSPSNGQPLVPVNRCMYLEPLIDDPLRSSAWRISSSIRKIAYSIISLDEARHVHMIEIDRRGERSMETSIQLSSLDDIAVACATLADLLQKYSLLFTVGSQVEKWRCVAILLVLSPLVEENVKLPSRAEVRQLSKSDVGTRSWAFMHFRAQVEGVLYSLRILRQILEVYAAVELPGLPPRIDCSALWSKLQHLPPLCSLLTSATGAMPVGSEIDGLEKEMSHFYDASLTHINQDGFVKPKGKAERRPKTVKEGNRVEPITQHSANLYDLLDEA